MVKSVLNHIAIFGIFQIVRKKVASRMFSINGICTIYEFMMLLIGICETGCISLLNLR